MANVDISFKGMEELQKQIEQLNSPIEKDQCLKECTNTLAQVYIRDAIMNTKDGGSKEYSFNKDTYEKINAVSLSAKNYKMASTKKARRTKAVKRTKINRKTKKTEYLVRTGSEHMKRSWGADPATRQGRDYSARVFNTASYASYVNDGHRQRPGRYVPYLGKRLVKSWVSGQHMAEKAAAKTKRVSKRALTRIIGAYLERGLRNG